MLLEGTIPATTAVNFYLVPPPAPGDLAGLAVADTTGDQIGPTDAITIRPSGNSDGVGVTLGLTLPNTLGGVPISITEIESSFTGIRYPATCPATAANVTLSANSYSATATTQTAATALPVSGCAGLAYNPRYTLTAARDANDKQVKLTTTITQTASESPNATVQLAFPLDSLAPTIAALRSLCSAGPASGTCTPVGSVTATSPDYPTPLTGQAYLTGSLAGLSLTLLFPPPFPLTLVGSVDLKTNVTTFDGLPDIPLTSLVVTLIGGSSGLFSTNCATPTNTSTATLTDQNGDRNREAGEHVHDQRLPVELRLRRRRRDLRRQRGQRGQRRQRRRVPPAPGGPAHVSAARLSGLASGRTSLRLTLHSARRSTIGSFTVTLPKGMSFRTRRSHAQRRVRDLSLTGAGRRTERAGAHAVRITLKRAVRRVTLAVGRSGLKESRALRAKARATSQRTRLKRVRLSVLARTPRGRRTTIHVTITRLGLA